MLQYRVEVRQAWWFKHYAVAVAIGSVLSGRQPDMGKVERAIAASLSFRLVRERAAVAA
ncbi:MAG: hypothetical protein WCC51_07850 [Stenotrophomonas indicatrix]|uniref:hypothetical protein n=1 Tax=Stenotrophomonas indicatrix TaxID=2045451 RepID=UPI003C7ED610